MYGKLRTQIEQAGITDKQREKLLLELDRLKDTKYINQIKGFYVSRSGYCRFFTEEKAYNEFGLTFEEFEKQIIKPRKIIINPDGYRVYWTRDTPMNEHDIIGSKKYFKVSKDCICYRKSLYYNGIDKKGQYRYTHRWALNTNKNDVHHIDGDKTNNDEGNLENLYSIIHQYDHDLKLLVSKRKLSSFVADRVIIQLKRREINITQAKQIVKDKLEGF